MYLGNLDADQKSKLAHIWDLTFTVINHPDKAKLGEFTPDDEIIHHEDNLSKDDASKLSKALHEEQQALRDLFATHGVEEFHDQLWFLFGPDIPDMIMLKFLRARKWNVHQAFAMLCNCIKWRIEVNVADIIAKGDIGLSKEDPKYEIQGPAEKSYLLGFTPDELIPVISIHVKNHIAKAQPAETMTNFVIVCAETFRSLVTYPNDKVIILFDLGGFGLKNMDWHSLMTILKILEAYYPETLWKLYIHQAPWIFQGIWKAVSPMLDPSVRQKINFTGKPKDLDLIPPHLLEDKLGGQQVDIVRWVPPSPDEKQGLPRNDPQRQKMWKSFRELAVEYENVTKEWIRSNGQDDNLFAERDFHAKRLRLKFIEIDPYLRARTMYHRAGLITKDMFFDFTYKQANGRILKHVVGEEYSRQGLERAIAERSRRSDAQPKKRSSIGRDSAGPGSDSLAAGAGVGAAAGSVGAGVGAAAVASKRGRARDSGFKRLSRSQISAGESEEPSSRSSRQGFNDGGVPRRQSKTSEEMPSAHSRLPRASAESFDRGQSCVRSSTEASNIRSPNADVGLGAAAGAGTGAVGGAGAAMSARQAHRSRESKDMMYQPGRQYTPRGGSSAPSINSSMSDDIFVDANEFQPDDSLATYAPRDSNASRSHNNNVSVNAREADAEYIDEETSKRHEGEPESVEEKGLQSKDGPEAGAQSSRDRSSAGDQQSRRSQARRRQRAMNGENEGLAGFPNLANPEQTENIAENNEKMREPFDPNAGRKKPSLISRFMCCGGKSVD